MKKDEKQKLIEAVKTISDYCEKQSEHCKKCIFYVKGGVGPTFCALTNWPNFWLDDIDDEFGDVEEIRVFNSNGKVVFCCYDAEVLQQYLVGVEFVKVENLE